MSKNPIGRRVGAILERATMMLSSPFGDLRPVPFASRLLDERARGMVPVWPTTERYADRLVEGLEALRETRGPEVFAAIADAPKDTNLDWPARLSALIR